MLDTVHHHHWRLLLMLEETEKEKAKDADEDRGRKKRTHWWRSGRTFCSENISILRVQRQRRIRQEVKPVNLQWKCQRGEIAHAWNGRLGDGGGEGKLHFDKVRAIRSWFRSMCYIRTDLSFLKFVWGAQFYLFSDNFGILVHLWTGNSQSWGWDFIFLRRIIPGSLLCICLTQ